jgi:uncharacterized membrane protein
MPTVVTSRDFPELSVDRVWQKLRAFRDYASFMDHVLAIDILEDHGEQLISSWVVLFNGNELRWTEHDFIDDSRRRVEFSQIEGDLEVWRGQVEVFGGESSSACYTVEFDLGVPALADLLHPLGKKAIEENCRQMLESIATTLTLQSAS